MDDNKEKILAAAMQELKEKAGEVIQDIMSGLYSGYLPYIETDTGVNIGYRVEGCIKNIIAGKFSPLGEGVMFSVNDSYGYDHIVSLNQYATDLEALANALMPLMGDAILEERIKQLENKVSVLESNLRYSY